jgi:hypothetical protein
LQTGNEQSQTLNLCGMRGKLFMLRDDQRFQCRRVQRVQIWQSRSEHLSNYATVWYMNPGKIQTFLILFVLTFKQPLLASRCALAAASQSLRVTSITAPE